MTTKYQSGVRVSEYVLEECLGAGAFGEVWQARHHVWESDRVAVKLPTEPEYVRYLQREGVVVHGLRHPNIIRVLGMDPYADIPYLVMELVKGPSLRQVIQDNPHGLPIESVIVVLRGLLAAMAAAHAGQIIHRDLKPGNVLLGLAGRPLTALALEDVKVGDFGLGFASADTLQIGRAHV
jgi:serine/threonine-protein kinase